MKTLLIIPAHNEAQNIGGVIAEIVAQKLGADLLVVDDGSSDGTAALAEGSGAQVVRLPFNLGYGAAVQTGLLYAAENGYDACVLIDGDGQHDPKYIPELLAPLAAGVADLALGSRFLGSADYSIPLGRRLGMHVFSKLASVFTHQQITDPTSGFQAIGSRLMKFFVNDNYPYDFPDADTLIRLYFAGFKIKEVPVTIRPRRHGTSMHGAARSFYYAYKMFFSIFIALTQRRMLTQEESNALGNQSDDGAIESDSAADNSPTRATETAR
jgi:glycosyltransferase involved in cell wall biosynthesis